MTVVPRFSLCVALLSAPVVSSGCEKASPEPTPPSSGASARDLSPLLAAQGAAQSKVESAGPPRCVRKLPKEPPRSVREGPDPRCPADPEGGPPMVPIGHVAFEGASTPAELEVELMLTEARRERGLMYRRSLDDRHGMLFAWRRPSVHQFWMHNTCLPLDMLFIDEEGYVAGIVENVPTLNDEPRSVECPVPYVLEVNAGWSRKHGVLPGQRVRIEGVPSEREE